MQNDLDKLEKKIRIKKMDAHADELRLNKLKLLQKADKLDEEIAAVVESIDKLKQEIGE
jgi:hypothetical protein